MARTIVVAAGGVLGGAIFGLAGAWLALRIVIGDVEPLRSGGNLEEAFELGFRMFGYLLVWAFGFVVGFVVGSTSGPPLVAAAFRWGDVGRTVMWTMVAQAFAVPLAIAVALWLGSIDLHDLGAATAAAVVGFLAPGLARRRATRSDL